jgi:hypothetical protein
MGHAGRREDHAIAESDVVDAEADVVDTLLTLRELSSNASGNERVLHFAGSNPGGARRESAEDDQGAHRSDSGPTGSAAGPAAGFSRDGFGTHRQSHNTAPGPGSRPGSGAAAHALTSRPNSFSGKKRKPGVSEEEGVNGATQATTFRSLADGRDPPLAMTAESAALQLQQQLTAAAAEALGYRQGAVSAAGGLTGGATPVAIVG